MEKSNTNQNSLYKTFNYLENGTLKDYYVDCSSLTGLNANKYIFNKLCQSQKKCIQFIAGHKGCGKTTELLRLKEQFENNNYLVVYCPIHTMINLADLHYVDFMLAILKTTTEKMTEKEIYLNYTHLGNVNLSKIKDIIPFKGLDFSIKFSMITDHIQYSDYLRSEVRTIFDKQAYAFFNSFNEIISQAQDKLKQANYKDIIFIIDGLDKTISKEKNNSFDQLFINHSNIIKGLNLKMILTLPYDRLFSNKTAFYKDIWGENIINLPILQTKEIDNSINNDTDNLLNKIIDDRFAIVENIEDINISDEAFEKAIELSSGIIGQLFKLIQQSCLIDSGSYIEVNHIEKGAEIIYQTMVSNLSSKELLILKELDTNPEAFTVSEYSNLINNNVVLYIPQNKNRFVLNKLVKIFL